MSWLQGPSSPGGSEGAAALSLPGSWMPLEAQVKSCQQIHLFWRVCAATA